MTSKQRQASTGRMAEVRPVLEERSQGVCERCGRFAGEVLQAHHRILRSRGGGDSAANLAMLCPLCHNMVHSAPAAAGRDGWMLRADQDPEQEAVYMPDGWVLLGDDGSRSWDDERESDG